MAGQAFELLITGGAVERITPILSEPPYGIRRYPFENPLNGAIMARIEDVEGIGPVYGATLRAAGCGTAAAFL